jgi:hypothetical protein
MSMRPTARRSAHGTAGRYLRDETRVFVVSGQVAPQAAWREWNDELRLTGRQVIRGMGREHLLQAGYEFRNERLRRSTLTVADPDRQISVGWLQQEGADARAPRHGRRPVRSHSDFGSETRPEGQRGLRAGS